MADGEEVHRFTRTDVREPGSACPSLRTTIEADPAAIPAARRDLRARLLDWGLSAIANEVVLAAHELLANAVVHGCRGAADGTCRVTLTARCSETRLRIAVTDPATEVPRTKWADDEAEDGRGLRLVESVADCWGTTLKPDGSGKTVWLECAMEAP